MTTNETIARWAHKVYDGDGFTATEDVYIVKGNEKLLMMDHREGEPPYYYRPDTDIALWHGDDGLLAEVAAKELADSFFKAWLALTGRTGAWLDGFVGNIAWAFRRAEPAQLAAALVEVIGEK